MSIVGLDLKCFDRSAAGIGRYVMQLVKALTKSSEHDFFGYIGPRTETNQLPSNINISNGAWNKIQSSFVRSIYSLPKGARQTELFHSMDNSGFAYKLKGTYSVSTIFDTIIYDFPHFFTFKHRFVVQQLTHFAIKNSDYIITISESAKGDLLRLFPQIKSERIVATPLAADERFKPGNEKEVYNWLNDKKLPEQYFLSLGTNEPRKNLPNLIKAFRKFKQNPNNAKIGLVLVGGKGWLSDDLKLNELQEELIYPLGFLPDEDLPLVYSGALAFIFPSFYEGFGLPLVEAMSCGTPVITSDNSSLREVAGKYGIYLKPEKIDSIKEAMEIFIEELPNRKTLVEQSLIRAKEFSWSKTAKKTLDVYNYLLS